MHANQSEIHRLVSLTFDESPKVRKDAAKALSEVDDPAAIFALMELNYDKDAGVKKLAQDLLRQKQNNEQEIMSFAEIFGPRESELPKPEVQENPEDKKKRILHPIEQLFEKKLGKQKADAVKSKMMPTIEKVYFKAVDHKASEDLESGRKAMQEFLTSYLEAISDLDSMDPGFQQKPPLTDNPPDKIEVMVPESNQIQVELDTVGSKQKDGLLEIPSELNELEEEEKKEEKEEHAISSLPQTFLKKAYEAMMLSGGDDSLMKKELKRMLKEVEKDAKLAFNLAKKKFREMKITNLAKIKDGMKNVNTDMLFVKQVENLEYQKGRKKAPMIRLLVHDEDGNEGVIYLFDGRGSWIREGMNIKVIKGQVKTFEAFGETAISIAKKSNVYIVV